MPGYYLNCSTAILGMHKHVVHALVATLWAPDLQDSCYIMFKKKLAMFLYMSVTSLRIHHMREHFQHSNETISQWVHLPLQYSTNTRYGLVTTKRCLMCYQAFSSTTPTSIFLHVMLLFQSTSPRISNSFPTFKMSLELWMAHTFGVCQQQQSIILRVIVRVKWRKIYLPCVDLTWILTTSSVNTCEQCNWHQNALCKRYCTHILQRPSLSILR